MLKCPICGKSYTHDSKICYNCEEDSIRSGLVKENPSINNLLVFNNYHWFGKVEHHEFRVKRPPLYDWNCIVKARVLNLKENKPNLVVFQEFPLNNKVYPSLYFE